MGTASTMACMAEALGMTLPGVAGTPAPDSRLLESAHASGKLAVELVASGRTPSQVLSKGSFRNAIVALAAIGGSTNAVVHLLAIAGRAGVPLSLDDFDAIGADVPLLADVAPAGRFLMDDLYRAGGLLALLREVSDLLDPDALTVTGRPLAGYLGEAKIWDETVIRPRSAPVQEKAGIAVLRGSLAPGGAVIKPAAATKELLVHRGPAVVFDSIEDMRARLDDPALDVTEDSVLVLRGCGPRGYPGMPEVGNMPIPAKLLARGVRDMVRISDARMSGTAYGTVVLHTVPEGAAGGPLSKVRDGDPVVLDVPGPAARPGPARGRTRAARALAGHDRGAARPPPGLGAPLHRPRPAGQPGRRPRLPARLQRPRSNPRLPLTPPGCPAGRGSGVP